MRNRAASLLGRRPSRTAILAPFVSIVAFVLAGCGGSPAYLYRPAGAEGERRPVAAASQVNGYPAVRYGLGSSGQELGEMLLTSFGITEIDVDGRRAPALHLRVVARNVASRGQFWVDTRTFRLDLPSGERDLPAIASAARPELPMVGVPAREQRAIDLFYPLPVAVEDAEDVPAFVVRWELRTWRGATQFATRFERRRAEPPRARWVAWGGYWWFDPRWGGRVRTAAR